jgi:hypothetical protein
MRIFRHFPSSIGKKKRFGTLFCFRHQMEVQNNLLRQLDKTEISFNQLNPT